MFKSYFGNLTEYIEPIFFAWIFLACNFGALLFFSSTGSILNPEVPIWFSVLKDFVWLMFLALVISFSPILNFPYHLLPLILFSAAMLVIFILLSLSKSLEFIDYGLIKSVKNAVLYMWAPLLLACFIRINYHKFLRYLIAILSATLLLSIVIYFSFEDRYKPFGEEPRMFGTSGNPNTSSLFSLLLFILVAFYFDKLNHIYRWISLVLVFLSIYLSASYFYQLMLIIVIAYFSVLGLWRGNFQKIKNFWIYVLIVAMVAWLISAWLTSLKSTKPPIQLRVESALLLKNLPQNSLLQSDSIAVRVNDIKSFDFSWIGNKNNYRQFDSTLLTFAYNFGLFGIFFLFYPVFSLLLLKKFNWHSSNLLTHLFIIIVVLIFLSNLVHFQTSFFPANVFLHLIFSMTLVELLVQNDISKNNFWILDSS